VLPAGVADGRGALTRIGAPRPPACVAAAQFWAVAVSWSAPHEQYGALLADYARERRART